MSAKAHEKFSTARFSIRISSKVNPKKGKYLLWLQSDGGLTPGPNGEEARLRMKIQMDPTLDFMVNGNFVKENCTLINNACYGNPDPLTEPINEEFVGQDGWDVEDYTYQWSREGLTVRFYKDGYAEILWFFNYVPNPKGHGSGWIIRNRYMQTISTPLPPGSIQPGETIPIDISGPFWVQHDGVGVDTYDPTDYREEMNFSITLWITRLQ